VQRGSAHDAQDGEEKHHNELQRQSGLEGAGGQRRRGGYRRRAAKQESRAIAASFLP
jgi:hypothetical protein